MNLLKKITACLCSAVMIISMFTLFPECEQTLTTYALSFEMESAVQWAINTANDESHGYSQSNRNGPDYDCSSFVYYALKSAGLCSESYAFNTSGMSGILPNNNFTYIQWSYIGSVSNLQRGDILWYRYGTSGHTEIYLGNNQMVGAHGCAPTTKNPYRSSATGDQGNEVSVCNYYNQPPHVWMGVFRYNGNNPLPNDDELGIGYPRPSGSPVLKKSSVGSGVSWLQSALNIAISAGLSTDGQFGTLTENAVKSFQSKYGLTVDGQAGPQTINKLVEVIKEILNPPAPVAVIPSKPTLSVNAGNNYSKTVLNWNNCDNANWYDIHIYTSDGINILSLMNYYTTSYTIFMKSGDYYANVTSVNENMNYTYSENVSFTVSDGTITPAVCSSYNGHVYAVYDADTTWTRAKEICEHLGGHLVTVTSAEENEFVANLIQNGSRTGYWLGAADSETEGKFQWITGEAMIYDNKDSGQYDNSGGIEDSLEMWKNGKWNDTYDEYTDYARGFVIEIEDQSGNIIADEIYAGTGNRYVIFNSEMSWSESEKYCEMLGGHLAYVTNDEENSFIYGLTSQGTKKEYWLGAYKSGNPFKWADGTELSYSLWDSGQPDNYIGIENYCTIWSEGKWNDNANTTGNGFVCEFENTFSKNLTLESKTDTEIKVKWTGVMYGSKYNLYLDGEKIGTTTDVSYTVTDLNAQTEYEIFAEAVSDGKIIGTTDVISVTTAQKITFKGKGTKEEPYLISTEDDLYCMAAMINDSVLNSGFGTKYYHQTNDIIMTINRSFDSIGNSYTPFNGVYDGGFYTISNVSTVYGGLFGQVGSNSVNGNATIRNLIVKGRISEVSCEYTGGIVGTLCSNSVIENCAVIGQIKGTGNAGGIVGIMTDSSTVKNCYHNGTVSAENVSGGIVACVNSGNVLNTYHTVGTVTAATSGGIIGKINDNANVQNNFYLKGTAESSTLNGAIAANEIVMKELAVTLGNSFEADYNNINKGYPVLIWQNGIYQFEGSGTESDPYQINSTDDFIQMKNYINSQIFNSIYGKAHYIQKTDVVLISVTWNPIGDSSDVPFSGEYDGNSYSIYGLNSVGKLYGGLFGEVNGGYIHNVSVINSSVKCADSNGKSGGIAAVVSNGTIIQNCTFIGSVYGVNYVGGIVGCITDGADIENCYQTGTVSGNTNVGGIIGSSISGQSSIVNSYHAGGNITASHQYGGISGAISDNTTINNCYYLKSNSNYGVNNGSNSGAMSVTGNVLKLLSEDLGEAYSTNISEYFNEGYPVFKWQDFSQENDVLYGDINQDGTLSVADILLLKKHIMGTYTLSLDELILADINQDNTVDVLDFISLKQLFLSLR